MPRTLMAVIFAGIICVSSPGAEPQVRYVEKNGITYRVTEHVVRRPIQSTQWERREQTVYRPETRAELRETVRTYRVPVTELHWVSRMHGRWNPFTTPYYTHHLVPVTTWEHRSQRVPVPVARTEWVPQTRVVEVPVRKQEMVEDKYVSQVVVAGPPASAGSRVASREPLRVGGTLLESDPPRKGWQGSLRR